MTEFAWAADPDDEEQVQVEPEGAMVDMVALMDTLQTLRR